MLKDLSAFGQSAALDPSKISFVQVEPQLTHDEWRSVHLVCDGVDLTLHFGRDQQPHADAFLRWLLAGGVEAPAEPASAFERVQARRVAETNALHELGKLKT